MTHMAKVVFWNLDIIVYSGLISVPSGYNMILKDNTISCNALLFVQTI